MTDSFKKLKKKALVAAIIKSIVAGVFGALFVVGVVLLSVKLASAYLAWYFYLLIGLGAGAIAFGGTFFLTYPRDYALAKKIDIEYGLNEKVQTMVEYYDREGEIIDLQRSHAEEVLGSLPSRKISFKKIWQYIVVAILGMSFFLAGVLVPSTYVPPLDDDHYEISEWDKKNLNQLIDDVRNSELQNDLKTVAVSALELLRDDLETITKKSEMQAEVVATAEIIDASINKVNTYRDVALALDNYKKMDAFKNSIVKAVDSYKTEDKILTIEEVAKRHRVSEGNVVEALEVFTEAFEVNFDSDDKSKMYDAYEEFLSNFNESMHPDNFVGLTEDSLYVTLSDYSLELGSDDFYDNFTSYSVSYIREYVKLVDGKYVSSVSGLLVVQVYNRMIDEYVCNKLSDIFGVNVAPEELVLKGAADEDDNSSNNPSHDGGEGEENTVLGGYGTVYDPETGEHVYYGKIWMKQYYSELYNRINAEDSDIGDELKEHIKQYIEKLNGSDSSQE